MTTVFLLAAYGWAWLVWIPFVIIQKRSGGEFPLLVVAIGAYGPTIAAVIVTAWMDGAGGVRQLLRKYVIWRVHPGWYLAAVLVPSIPAVAVTAIHLWRGGHLGSPDIDRVAALPVAAGLSVLVGPLGEELGWRGFLLPRLAERMDLLSASLLVGVVWTFWHAPLFWAPSGSLISGAPVTVQSVAVFLAIVAGLSCLIAWVWHHARGSVVLTILMHLSINMNLLATIFPAAARAQQQMAYAGIVALWLLVLTIIVAERRTWFGRRSGGDVDDVVSSS